MKKVWRREASRLHAYPVTRNAVVIFAVSAVASSRAVTVSRKRNRDYLIDERLTSSGFGRLDSFRDRRWSAGDAVWPIEAISIPYPASRVPFPSSSLAASTGGRSFLLALDISSARLFRHVDKLSEVNRWVRRTDGDNNDNDKRVNNTPTYSATRLWTILMMDRCNRCDESRRGTMCSIANSGREVHIPFTDHLPALIDTFRIK